MSRFSTLSVPYHPDHCAVFAAPESMTDRFKAATGVRMGDAYDAQRFRLADEAPGIVMSDFVHNALGFLMVKGRVRDLLAARATAEIEFLPFALLDHKGRVADPEAWIVNVLGTSDCVDLQRTVGTAKAGRTGQFLEITELHLDEARVDRQQNIFRIAARPRVIVVRDDLRAALEELGVTGARFTDMGQQVEL